MRYDLCDTTCTVDCGHCKGKGRPNVVDVGNQRPIKWTKEGHKAHEHSFLTRCWGCRTEGAVERDDGLGLCPACLPTFRHPNYPQSELESEAA